MWATIAKMLPSLEGFGGPDGGAVVEGHLGLADVLQMAREC